MAQVATLDVGGAGGVEVHIRRLAEGLRALGAEVEVIGSGAARKPRDWGQFDIIHTHGCVVPRSLLRRQEGVRRVHTLHGVSVDYLLACRAWGNWRCYWATGMEWLGSRAANRVIAVSESVRRRAVGVLRAPEGKVTVVGNGWSGQAAGAGAREAMRGRLGLKEEEVAVLFVGRGEDKVKGAGAVIAAMAEVRRRRPVARLVAAPGTGFEGVEGAIRTGVLGHEEMAGLYGAGDVFVNASLNEGMPLTVLEAMGAGLALVAAPVGGIPEVVRDGETGVLTRKDRSDLAEQLGRVIGDRLLRQQIGANAANAAQGCTWEAVARKTLDVYEAVLRDSELS